MIVTVTIFNKYEQIVAIDPKDYDIRYDYAAEIFNWLYMDSKATPEQKATYFEKLISSLNTAIEIDPKKPEAHLLMGKTTLTSKGLGQTWIWDKQVELRDLAYAKLIRVPGLDWLIAPRVYVRTLMGKFTVIYACDPDMVEEFKRLSAELKKFRSM